MAPSTSSTPTQVARVVAELQARPDRVLAAVFLAKMLGEPGFVARLESGAVTHVLLPSGPIDDAAGLARVQQLAASSSLAPLYGDARPVLAPGTALVAEEVSPPLVLLFADGPLPLPTARPIVAPPKAQSSPPAVTPRTSAEWQALFDANVAATKAHGPRRVVMAPSKKAYARELVHALGVKLDESAISWFSPTHAEVESCERRFLETARRELEAGKIVVLPKERAYALAPIFSDFPRYERQAVGWSARGARYVYLRFRLENAVRPQPLDEEYDVRDGGRAYWELQCAVPGLYLFNVRVNGEA